ncbi:unnamed protein product, partial [Closterium sp. Naga37s-1]
GITAAADASAMPFTAAVAAAGQNSAAEAGARQQQGSVSSEMMGSGGEQRQPQRYLAVHWRRGDLLLLYQKILAFLTVKNAGRCIVERMVRSGNISTVFLATDADEEEVGQLERVIRSHLPGVEIVQLPEELTGQPWAKVLEPFRFQNQALLRATLDKAVCALADVFMGTPKSSFSSDIERLRTATDPSAMNLSESNLPGTTLSEQGRAEHPDVEPVRSPTPPRMAVAGGGEGAEEIEAGEPMLANGADAGAINGDNMSGGNKRDDNKSGDSMSGPTGGTTNMRGDMGDMAALNLLEEEEGIADPPLSIYSILTFSWLSPLMAQGVRQVLGPSDLYPLPSAFSAQHLGAKLSALWAKRNPPPGQQRRGETGAGKGGGGGGGGGWAGRYWAVCVWPFRWRLTLVAVLIVAESAQRILSAFLLRQLVRFSQAAQDLETSDPAWRGLCWLAVLMGLLPFPFSPPSPPSRSGVEGVPTVSADGAAAFPFPHPIRLAPFIFSQVRFLQDAQDPETADPAWRGYLLAVLMGLLALGFALLHHQIWNLSQIVGWNLRVASMTLINSKLLSLNGGALTRITTGHCITLMSNDVRRFDELPMFAQFLWAAPLELVVVTALIVLEVGAQPAFAGIAALLALIPLQALFGHFFAKQRRRTVEFTDARVKMTGEVLSGILAVKMFAWEAPFTSFIQRIRNKERRNIELASYIKAFNESSYFASSSMVSLVIFATYTLQGGYLQPSTVFYVISLVQLPRLYMCVFFPTGIERVAEAAISFSRLEAFMRALLCNPCHPVPNTFPPSPLPATLFPSRHFGLHDSFAVLYPPLCQMFEKVLFSHPLLFPLLCPEEREEAPGGKERGKGQRKGGSSGSGDSGEMNGVVNGEMKGLVDGAGNGELNGEVRGQASSDLNGEVNGHGIVAGGGGGGSSGGSSSASSIGGGRIRRKWMRGARRAVGRGGRRGGGEGGRAGERGEGRGGEREGGKEEEKEGEEDDEGVVVPLQGVGAGKSTLLAGILGDAELMGGEMVCRADKIAYAAQKPFIMAGTLQDNIIFGRPFQADLYSQVLDACALRRDIANWPRGDLTEIGERGVNLSGGQKARVGLARAAYARDAALLLLDDPLSAVDPAVGRHLFEQCIRGVMQGRPRIVVTHQLQYLPSCDRVLVLDGGKPVALGPYADLATQVDFQGLLGGDEVEGDEEAEGEVGGTGEEDDLLAPAGGAKVGDGREKGGVGEGGVRLQRQCLFTVGEDGDEEGTGTGTGSGGDGDGAIQHSVQKGPSGSKSSSGGVIIPIATPVKTPAAAASSQPTSTHAPSSHDDPSFQALLLRRLRSITLRDRSLGRSSSGSSKGGGVKLSRSRSIMGSFVHRQPGGERGEERVGEVGEEGGDGRGEEGGEGMEEDGAGQGGLVGVVEGGVCLRVWMRVVCSVRMLGAEGAEGGGHGLVQKERKEEGMVSLQVYLGYTRRVGVWQSLLLVVLLAFGQTLACAGDWFLAFWSQKKDQSGPYRPIYTALVLTGVVTSFLRSGLFFRWCVRAASRIHSAMLACVLGSPLAFFHANPIGRILNRFSADQGILDDLLPFTLFNYLQTLSLAVGAIVMVALGVPWILIPMAVLFLLFLRLRYIFLCTSREAKRLEAITRSPVCAHYAATIQGLTTIRAFGAQQQSATIFHRLLNANGRAFYCWLAASRWLAFRLDTIVSAVVFLVATLAVALRTTLAPGLVALALSYTLQMSGMLQWAVRQGAEVENMFTGVERALEYTHLPQEEGLEVGGQQEGQGGGGKGGNSRRRWLKGGLCGKNEEQKQREGKGEQGRGGEEKQGEVLPGWPNEGAVRVEGLTVRYRPTLDPVLQDVSFQLLGGEKCGVVGRTGAGKSTLMLALFRLVQPSGGCILIDGVDTATISLTRLRRNVMAIPQDPVLFGSSLRFNLDPFNQHPDAALWEALDAVQLRGKAGGLQRGLEASMSEFGENFSVGQRQLVCLARAVLHRSRILLMDEATANVDMATDALIQTTIRRQFAASTVITIAHRLHTIIDADKVLVLEQGRVVQFGSPQQLAADRVGSFSRMISNTGRSAEASLRSALARDGSLREASLRDASVKEAAAGDVSGREEGQRDKEDVNIDVMPLVSDGLLCDRDLAAKAGILTRMA